MIYGDDYSPEPELNEVDVLFFEVGDIVYGTDASQVLRIDRSHPDDLALPELGALKRGNRAIVFDTPEGEGHLKVDAIRAKLEDVLLTRQHLPRYDELEEKP